MFQIPHPFPTWVPGCRVNVYRLQTLHLTNGTWIFQRSIPGHVVVDALTSNVDVTIITLVSSLVGPGEPLLIQIGRISGCAARQSGTTHAGPRYAHRTGEPRSKPQPHLTAQPPPSPPALPSPFDLFLSPVQDSTTPPTTGFRRSSASSSACLFYPAPNEPRAHCLPRPETQHLVPPSACTRIKKYRNYTTP